ncbi:unnamed protein product [Symbiodinium natans]|uniref:Uncharacterized protein n=1 Tax=Symbiodinium natans TaxID=878477 RepID=A0A812JIE9_9DINO|nr:unnamed protein product [Symbiodinium natans]
MALAFANFNAQTRVAGNRIVDRPWQLPQGWNASLDALNTETRDASGKGSFDTSMVLLQPYGLDLKPSSCQYHSYLQMFKRTEELVDSLKNETADGIKGIMGLGDKMSKSHLDRFKSFEKLPPKQAVLALCADMGAEDWNNQEENRKYAEKHLRILSGLYGVVRPYDDVKPVRDIPMNAKVKTKKGLYLTEFWGDSITKQLSKDLKSISEGNKGGHCLLVKCTSDEYFQSVQSHNLPEGTTLVEIQFEQAPEDVTAKARCLFARFVIEKKICTPEGLKDFKSQEWSLDERRCTIQKVFYVWIGDDRHRKKKQKKEDKGKEKEKSDASGEDRRKGPKKKKGVKEAQDFSDMESDEPKPKGKKKKVERDRTPPQDFSDMDSEEFQSRTKKGKKGKAPPPSDESSGGSGKKKKVRRKKSEASEEDRGRKKGKEDRKRKRGSS